MSINEIADYLKNNARNIVLASHYNPEGDAIGSILALGLVLDGMGKQVHLYNRDGIPSNLEFLPQVQRVKRELPSWHPDTAVIADCGDFHRVGKVEEQLKKTPTIINIDHHGTNTRFGHMNWVLPKMASTGEMMAELIDALKVSWTPEVATCVYTAIVGDTGSFQFGNTTPNSFKQAARMVEFGADPSKIAMFLFYDQPARNMCLLAKVLNTLRIEDGGKIATVEVTSKMFEDTGTSADASEGFVDYPRSIRGVRVAVLLRQTGDSEWKVSMRSKGTLDVARIAQSFNGGGHVEAAGCTLNGTLEAARSLLLERIGQAMAETARG